MKRYMGRGPRQRSSVLVQFGARHGGTWKHSCSPTRKLSNPLILRVFYCCSNTVVCIFAYHASHPHLPPLIPPPFGFVHVSFIVVPENPFPSPAPLSPPTSPLITVSLFLISMSLVIFCLLDCLSGPKTYGTFEILWRLH